MLAPGQATEVTASLAEAYARSGWNAFWEKEVELCTAANKKMFWRQGWPCGSMWMARRYGRLGNRARAIAALDTAYREPSQTMVFIKIEPYFRDLRADPQFQDLELRYRHITDPQSAVVLL